MLLPSVVFFFITSEKWIYHFVFARIVSEKMISAMVNVQFLVFFFTRMKWAVNFFTFVLVPERHEAYRLLLRAPSYFFSSDCRWNTGAIL